MDDGRNDVARGQPALAAGDFEEPFAIRKLDHVANCRHFLVSVNSSPQVPRDPLPPRDPRLKSQLLLDNNPPTAAPWLPNSRGCEGGTEGEGKVTA